MRRRSGKSTNPELAPPRRAVTPADRRHSRFLVSLPVRCTRVAGRTPGAWDGHTADIGSGGFAVELPARLPPGTRVAIEVRTGIGPLRMEAEVLWTRRVAGGAGLTRHGLCLADRSEVLDLPVGVLLGQWLQGLAKRERTRGGKGSAPGQTRTRRKTRR